MWNVLDIFTVLSGLIFVPLNAGYTVEVILHKYSPIVPCSVEAHMPSRFVQSHFVKTVSHPPYANMQNHITRKQITHDPALRLS